MKSPYEIHIGKALQNAWNIFLRAPEVFTILTLAYLLLYYVCAHLPFLGALLTLLVTPLFYPSVFLLAEQDRKNGKADFSVLKNVLPVAPQLLMVALLRTIFVTIGLICFLVPGIYLAVSYTFAQLIVLEEKKTFWEALEGSRALVRGNWFTVFGLWFFATLLFVSGFLLAGIGILVTAPVSILMLYCAYREILRGTVVVA